MKRGGAGRKTLALGACVLVAGLASGCAMLDPQGRAVQQASADHEGSPVGAGQGEHGSTGVRDAAAREAAGETLFGVPVEDLPFGPGPFDKEAPGFAQFNPCTEIPDEALHQAGVSREEKPHLGTKILLGAVLCRINRDKAFGDWPRDDSGSYSTNSTIAPQEQDQEYEVEIISRDSSPFRSYTASNMFGRPGCTSGVITDRGRWEINYTPHSGGYGIADDCSKARGLHEDIVKNLQKS